jgi:PIN domain nuclease of toxin-antitoxin system
LEDPTGEFLVSVASLWEIAKKQRIGKLQLAPSLQILPDLIDAMNMELLSITARHVLAAVESEPLTRDPFDRLLLAQCQIEDLRLITLDRSIVQSSPIHWRQSNLRLSPTSYFCGRVP